jgi:Uma2 family endonuclease
MLTLHRRMTLEEYLDFTDASEFRTELVDGELREMGSESELNVLIGSFLFAIFLQFVPYYCIRRGTEIVVPGRAADTRYPDLLILTEAGVLALAGKKRSCITVEMPAPAIAIEVVSLGKPENYDRDYVDKRSEYAVRGIVEYWIIDPQRDVVWVLNLQGDRYVETLFTGNAVILSPTFPGLTITAIQVLNAGR